MGEAWERRAANRGQAGAAASSLPETRCKLTKAQSRLLLRRMSHSRTFIVVVFLSSVLLGALTGLSGCRAPGGGPQPSAGVTSPWRPPPRPLPAQIRAVWVARFHYRQADDVRTIIRNCAAVGCNTVLWQVRGEGTVTYPSHIEPWSREFNFQDPGFDPLAIAVSEAHRHGLRIEAWFNVVPGWKGRQPPPTWLTSQLWYAHPEWFLHDAAGRPQPLNDNYVILNPCWPEVRRHIVSVVDELLSRYDLDGIHLDYVRYAWDGDKNGKERYPRDARTLALYRRETGRAPDDDPGAWDHWRANQLTRLVAEIRTTVERRRPGASLTAAVWRDPQLGYRQYLQNSVAWLRSGLVDALMPMAYTEQADRFVQDIELYRRLVGARRIVPGIGLYLHKTPDATAAQMRACADWGGSCALFSYEALFATAGDRQAQPQQRAEAQRLRQLRRQVLGEFFSTRAASRALNRTASSSTARVRWGEDRLPI